MKIRLGHGFSVDINGAPRREIHDAERLSTVALLGADYQGTNAALTVAEGDRVSVGQTLFTDRRSPEIRFTSSATGRVAAIRRGARRKLVAIVIELDDDEVARALFDPLPRERLSEIAADDARCRLLESGLWTAIRARPFDRVAAPEVAPSAIFITAIDTHPLGADPAAVMAGREQCFADGIAVLAALCSQLYVCKDPQLSLPDLHERARIVSFEGNHPAGLPGTHIAKLQPASISKPVWHIGYQEVMAIGELFVSGRLNTERVVALGGPAAKNPRLLRTRIGASLEDLLADETTADSHVVAGCVYSPRSFSSQTAWLGRYETQLGAFEASLDETAGEPVQGRGMLPVEAFERVWPFDSPVLAMLRTLLTSDVEAAVALGCLDLAEEDLGLCQYLCPAQLDYAAALRGVLNAVGTELAR